MRRSLRALACCIAATGCGEIVASPPERATAQAAVVVFADTAGATYTLVAANARTDWAVRGDAPETWPVVVAYYDLSLAALGLEAGPVDGGVDARCARLFPDEVWSAAGPDAAFERADLPEAIAELLVPGQHTRCGRCRPFIESRVDIPGRERRLEGGALLSDGSVLGIGGPGELYAIEREQVERITGCPAVPYESVVPIGGDHFYLGTYGGGIHELAIDVRERTCAKVGERATTSTRTIEWMAVSPGGDELVAMDVAARVHYGAGGGPLEQILELPINERKFTRAEGINRGAVVWLGPSALVANGSASEIVFWSAGAVRRQETFVGRLMGDSVSELALIGGEIYAGDGGGQVLRFPADGGPSVLIDGNPLNEIIGTLLPDRDGFIATSGEGLVVAYYPTVGWCTPHPIAGTTDRGRHVFRDARGDLVIADMIGKPGFRAQVVWLSKAL